MRFVAMASPQASIHGLPGDADWQHTRKRNKLILTTVKKQIDDDSLI